MPLNLVVQLPDEGALHRLLDAEALQRVAREPGVFAFVIKDGEIHPVLAGDPR